MTTNPFELRTASKLNAEEAAKLWCDDKRLLRAQGPENCFINGHRGTGKTMLFRIMRPDCQLILREDNKLQFFGIYLSIRDSDLAASDYLKLEDHNLRHSISESQLTLNLLKELFCEIRTHYASILPQECSNEFSNLISRTLGRAYGLSDRDFKDITASNIDETLNNAVSLMEDEKDYAFRYVELLFDSITPFNGPLFSYERTIAPITQFIAEKSRVPIYFMIDDADDLTETATEVLNTWIARRNASVVFKVSTMFAYKTYRTRNRSAIQHPHDFYMFEVATRFVVGGDEDYINLVRRITKKRLSLQNITTSPEDFFPEDVKQNQEIDIVRLRLETDYALKYKSERAIRDNVYRHTLSEYMRMLNSHRSLGEYRYCGIKMLAQISSGLVRDFILGAQRMYNSATKEDIPPKFIAPEIQDRIVRQLADELLTEQIGNSSQKRFANSEQKDWDQVQSLIEAVGGTFKAKMLSTDSERRVFSFAFQDEPDGSLNRCLQLALQEGYLMRGVMARKEGNGRRTLYVLTRRLAPAFSLDPSAYSGYLSMTTNKLLEAMRKKRIIAEDDSNQLEFVYLDNDNYISMVIEE